MPTVLYHLNPETERIGRCHAQNGLCPFSSANPHFATKEDAQSYYESALEEEYGLFGSKDGELSLSRSAVARRLNILPDESLQSLIRERFRRGGYTPRETEAAMEKGEPFYVRFNRNQEITMDPDGWETQQTFMKGACAFFAIEVHRATGWPLAVYSSDEYPGSWEGHVAVKLPDGSYLDVSGKSEDPVRSFGPSAQKWSVSEARDIDELLSKVAGRHADGTLQKVEDLELLERFALAKIVYDVLDSEELLTD